MLEPLWPAYVLHTFPVGYTLWVNLVKLCPQGTGIGGTLTKVVKHFEHVNLTASTGGNCQIHGEPNYLHRGKPLDPQ